MKMYCSYSKLGSAVFSDVFPIVIFFKVSLNDIIKLCINNKICA